MYSDAAASIASPAKAGVHRSTARVGDHWQSLGIASRFRSDGEMLGWTAPDGISCARLRLIATTGKRSRPMTIIRIGLDTSKHVFQLHGVDEQEQPVLRRQIRRSELEKFFAKLPPTRVGLEACGASHHWARVLRGMGHEAVLMPPQYIKPYVKRGKNDAIDAEAICEAMSRPGMRFVPVKSTDEQAALMLLKVRDLLIKQRTMVANAIRGHAAEFGVIGAKGPVKLGVLLQKIAEDAHLPALTREMLATLGGQLAAIEMRLGVIGARLMARHKAD